MLSCFRGLRCLSPPSVTFVDCKLSCCKWGSWLIACSPAVLAAIYYFGSAAVTNIIIAVVATVGFAQTDDELIAQLSGRSEGPARSGAQLVLKTRPGVRPRVRLLYLPPRSEPACCETRGGLAER